MALRRRWSARRPGGLRCVWPGILALALAAAILQAGVFDQSLFSESYRDIDYWSGLVDPTSLPCWAWVHTRH